MEKIVAIATVCRALADETPDAAIAVLKEYYPFAPKEITKRRYRRIDFMRVFVRDGFIDRYSGERLIFPPVLRVLSSVLPEDFPYHPNWKTDVTHPAYWQVAATIDHYVPVTHGGADDETNWVTTSMAHNQAKMNWMLVELGWTLHPEGDIQLWDGLVKWFLQYATTHPQVMVNPYIRQWHRAAKLVFHEAGFALELP